MTGFSRFLHHHETVPPWYLDPPTLNIIGKPVRLASYSKSEDPSLDLAQFDYLISSKPASELQLTEWKTLRGFSEVVRYGLGWSWSGGLRRGLELRESVRVLRRRAWANLRKQQ